MARLFIIGILAILVGCKEISFREPQPKGRKPLSQVPKNLHGKYLTVEDNGEISKDTVVINASGYHFGYFYATEKAGVKQDKYDIGILNDSLVIKTFKGYYFLNFNENPEWLLRVIKKEKNGDLTFMTPGQHGVDFKDYYKNLSAVISIDSAEVNGKTLYQIDPSPKQLVELIEKGFFSKAVLKRVE
jgi:hypothetical protein